MADSQNSSSDDNVSSNIHDGDLHNLLEKKRKFMSINKTNPIIKKIDNNNNNIDSSNNNNNKKLKQTIVNNTTTTDNNDNNNNNVNNNNVKKQNNNNNKASGKSKTKTNRKSRKSSPTKSGGVTRRKTKKKILSQEEKAKKRQEQMLKNRQMSKNSRQRKEQRFAVLEKELNKIQADLKVIKTLSNDMSKDNNIELVFNKLLESHEFWNRKETYNDIHKNNDNASLVPERRMYDPNTNIEYIRFLPSKILESRDGTRRRPFINPVVSQYQNMQRELWRKEVINAVNNDMDTMMHTNTTTSTTTTTTTTTTTNNNNQNTNEFKTKIRKWILQIHDINNILFKHDVNHLGMFVAMMNKRKHQTAVLSSSTLDDNNNNNNNDNVDDIHNNYKNDLIDDLMKNLNLSDDQFTELSHLTDEATNEAHKCRLFFEMEAKLEQAIDSCIPTLEKYQQNMKNWFVRDDLLFKLFRIIQANIDGIRYLDMGVVEDNNM